MCIRDRYDREGTYTGTIRKVKLSDPLEAIKIINAMLGYNMPAKVANTDAEGKTLKSTIDVTKLPTDTLKQLLDAATAENKD